jgi:acyl-CoA synthetase (AMP-forming)/AMP-acid ligase II
VIGVKDEIYGEEVAAWIVPDREVPDPKQMVSDLLKLAEGKLAHYKLPRYIYLAE